MTGEELATLIPNETRVRHRGHVGVFRRVEDRTYSIWLVADCGKAQHDWPPEDCEVIR